MSSVQTDLVLSRTFLHRGAQVHPVTGIHSASPSQRWTGAVEPEIASRRQLEYLLRNECVVAGCRCTGTGRQPMPCRAVAAAEPAQQQLDVTKVQS